MTAGARRAVLVVGALLALPALAVVLFGLPEAPNRPRDFDSEDAPAPRPVAPSEAPSATAEPSARSTRSDPVPSALPTQRNPNDAVAAALRLQRSDPARCRELLRETIASDPQNVRAIEALSVKMLNDENHHEARELALQCLELDPTNEVCDKTRRYSLTPYNADDKATGFLVNCLQENPNSLPCLSGMVVEKVRLGEIDEAKALSEKLAAAHPGQAMTQLSVARVAAAELHYGSALEEFARACEAGQEYSCYRAGTLRAEGW